MKKKSTAAVDDVVEQYADAILKHLQWGVVRGGKKAKHHIIVSGRVRPGAKVESLCAIGEPLIMKDAPVLYSDRCKQCDMTLARLVTLVVASRSRYLFRSANAEVSVSLDEIRDALLALDEDEQEQIAYEKLMFPEEYLPTGSGQLLQRGW